MKLILVIEKKDGEWFTRLQAPDGVELVATDYLDREHTVQQAQGFVELAAKILEC